MQLSFQVDLQYHMWWKVPWNTCRVWFQRNGIILSQFHNDSFTLISYIHVPIRTSLYQLVSNGLYVNCTGLFFSSSYRQLSLSPGPMDKDSFTRLPSPHRQRRSSLQRRSLLSRCCCTVYRETTGRMVVLFTSTDILLCWTRLLFI